MWVSINECCVVKIVYVGEITIGLTMWHHKSASGFPAEP